ncbi:MAG TPA: hypothetical protein VM122_00315 [Usitatibacter sp.]|nr:hypothetical protein [Usitatibacter sp.]
MDVTYELRPHYVIARAAGAWDVAASRVALQEILRLCKENSLTRVMVDGTRIDTLIPISDRYDMASMLAEVAGGRTRMALLMSTENMFSKTFENTAANRGIHVRTTDSLQEALAFLQLPAASQ